MLFRFLIFAILFAGVIAGIVWLVSYLFGWKLRLEQGKVDNWVDKKERYVDNELEKDRKVKNGKRKM